jgi:hypothetical protein
LAIALGGAFFVTRPDALQTSRGFTLTARDFLMAQQTISVQSESEESGTERRARVRFAKYEEVWCQPVPVSSKEELDTEWLGKIQDISPDGIGLNMSRRFEPETVLIIKMRKGSEVLGYLLHVVHATPETNGRWLIGCKFDRVLSSEELRIILAE